MNQDKSLTWILFCACSACEQSSHIRSEFDDQYVLSRMSVGWRNSSTRIYNLIGETFSAILILSLVLWALHIESIFRPKKIDTKCCNGFILKSLQNFASFNENVENEAPGFTFCYFHYRYN